MRATKNSFFLQSRNTTSSWYVVLGISCSISAAKCSSNLHKEFVVLVKFSRNIPLPFKLSGESKKNHFLASPARIAFDYQLGGAVMTVEASQ